MEGTKVLKGCVTMKVLRGEPSSVGTQAARDKLCQSLRNYFFVQPRGLVRDSRRGGKDTSNRGKVHVSRRIPSYTELTRKLPMAEMCIVNHLLFC